MLLSSIRLLASLLSQSELDASRREDLERIQAPAVSASHLAAA